MSSLDLPSVVAERWGREITDVRIYDGEHDRTRRIVTDRGEVWCLKVRNDADGARDALDVELRAMDLAAASTPVPVMQPTSDGDAVLYRDGHLIWVTSWLDGRLWADLAWRDHELCMDLGRTAARLTEALAPLDIGPSRTHHWDLRSIPRSIALHRDQVRDQEQGQVVDRALELFDRYVAGVIDELPQTAVHQDLNDHNVLVDRRNGRLQVSGVIDFGDLLHSVAITELAVAVAYAMLRTAHPLDAAAAVVAGWCQVRGPLDDAELAAIVPLAMGRLTVNALTWSARAADRPDYSVARSEHTWPTLQRLHAIPAAFAVERLRPGCPPPRSLSAPGAGSAASVSAEEVSVTDLDPHREELDGLDPTDAAAVRAALIPDSPAAIAHDSIRLDCGGPPDGDGGPATVQLGVELHLADGTSLRAPLDGEVISVDPLRLAHEVDGQACATHWRGLSVSGAPGDTLEAGELLGVAGERPIGVQFLTFVPDATDHIPDLVRPADRSAWTRLSLDPGPLLGLGSTSTTTEAREAVLAKRNRRLASSQRYYYRSPMNLVRGRDVELVDADGHIYLDAINNVTHVGHSNLRVVEAAYAQMRRLNTNSRFVYEQMGDYADRLASLLPDPLEVVFLVCTGSEANDLALRIARQVTGHDDIMVIDGAYHGNTTAVTGISPDRYKGPGGTGPPPTTHEVRRPDRYRGPFRYDHADPGAAYAADVAEVAERLRVAGTPPAAFIAESLMGTAGQIVHPDGYLAGAFAAVRAAGGLCISDEVQVGFGRLGERFWGFELGGVVPDIVTMGKPMGNGHPIAAVVTTRETADRFDQGMKYFNTFGGNPVSCAIAGAVLDELEDRDLQANALTVGSRFVERLRGLAATEPRIGDVRGHGLYLGIELVDDPDERTPASWLATEVSERMLGRGVIVYPNGVHGNCLKIKPPMVFADRDVDRFVTELSRTLAEIS